MGRILIFTGKGGVGKTSVAAAHAMRSAREGKKTLLVSTDMAHNLGDIFETSLGKEEKELAENLSALEIDPNYTMEHDFKNMMRAFAKLMNFSEEKGPEEAAEMWRMTGFPGMDELFSLLKLMDIYETGKYDRIIVDCAPTGETLSLLKFPELLSWYMEKVFPIGKVAVRILSPVAKAAFKVELPNRKAMTDIEKLYVKMIGLQELLKNRAVTSVRLVTIPEKMVVEETKRNYMYMNLYNFRVDGLYINRILPKDMENPFFEEWLQIQNQYIKELENVFTGLPVYYIPWYDSDLKGKKGIEKIEEDVLKGKDVFGIQENRSGERYEKTEEGYLLRLYLPCAQKENLELHESETDVILRYGNFKRNIPKPNVLRSYEITGAGMKEGSLNIYFAKRQGEGHDQ